MPLIAVTLGMIVSEAPVEAWLDEIARRESGSRDHPDGDDNAVGAAGEVSRYQIVERNDKGLPNIWRHYSMIRQVPPCTGHRDRTLPEWKCSSCSRGVARLIVLDCIRACDRAKKPVTFKNVYWYYQNGGF